MIQFSADFRSFRFQAFNALLLRAGEQEGEDKVNRYFSGHRISGRFGNTELGIHETVMTGGPKEPFHPGFLNPIFPYYFTDVMESEKGGDNITLAFDASTFLSKSFRLYGQLVVDEFYYEKEHYPNRTGWLAGFDWLGPFGRGTGVLHAEYVKIDRWVYNYEAESPWARMNYFNSILGYPIGPDGDLWVIAHEFALTRNTLVQIQGGMQRHGETTVFTTLHTNEQLEKNHPPFPFGVVEKTTFGGINLELRFLNICRAIIDWQGNWIQNSGHSRDTKNSDNRFSATMVMDVGGVLGK